MATAFLEAVKDAKEWFILWDELNLVEAHLAYRDGIYVKMGYISENYQEVAGY